MEIPADWKELLELLNARRVEYLIVGAHAMAFHGAPRGTGDLDLYVRPTAENARRVLDALREFGFGQIGLAEKDLVDPRTVVQLGNPPLRIDLITSIDGVSWEEADRGKARGQWAGVQVEYLGREEFLRNKKAVGRKKDLADIEALGGEE